MRGGGSGELVLRRSEHDEAVFMKRERIKRTVQAIRNRAKLAVTGFPALHFLGYFGHGRVPRRLCRTANLDLDL